MTALHIVPSNALAAAFPMRRRAQMSIEAQERCERWTARKAEIEATRPIGFQPRIEIQIPSRAEQILGDPTVHYFIGCSKERRAFVAVTNANRQALATGPVVLIATRCVPGRTDTLGVEAFEAENGTRLAAWLDRAAVAKGVELYACFTGKGRIERAAIVASLSNKPARASAFVSAGKYDLRAIMAAAVADARLARKVGQTWGAALSIALRDVWQAAKSSRPVVSA